MSTQRGRVDGSRGCTNVRVSFEPSKRAGDTRACNRHGDTACYVAHRLVVPRRARAPRPAAAAARGGAERRRLEARRAEVSASASSAERRRLARLVGERRRVAGGRRIVEARRRPRGCMRLGGRLIRRADEREREVDDDRVRARVRRGGQLEREGEGELHVGARVRSARVE